MSDTPTRTVREILNELNEAAKVVVYEMNNKRAVGQLRLAIADANRVLATPAASPWTHRPEAGWTDATLPEIDRMVLFYEQENQDDPQMKCGYYRSNGFKSMSTWSYNWTYITHWRYIDPPNVDARAGAEGASDEQS